MLSKSIRHWGNRLDLAIIGNVIEEKSRVLDLGCGAGELLEPLIKAKKVNGMGIDIEREKIIKCIAKGIPVIQQDLNDGLANFKDKSFDYVILSQTLQVVHHPLFLLKEMLRVGYYGIVSFPNFGHYSIFLNLLFRRRAPRSKSLPFEWYDSPNIHVLTIKDFRDFCKEQHINILREFHYHGNSYSENRIFANTFSEGCVALISEEKTN